VACYRVLRGAWRRVFSSSTRGSLARNALRALARKVCAPRRPAACASRSGEALGRALVEAFPEVIELELNPLKVLPRGSLRRTSREGDGRLRRQRPTLARLRNQRAVAEVLESRAMVRHLLPEQRSGRGCSGCSEMHARTRCVQSTYAGTVIVVRSSNSRRWNADLGPSTPSFRGSRASRVREAACRSCLVCRCR
jgi:hypothetical protein